MRQCASQVRQEEKPGGLVCMKLGESERDNGIVCGFAAGRRPRDCLGATNRRFTDGQRGFVSRKTAAVKPVKPDACVRRH